MASMAVQDLHRSILQRLAFDGERSPPDFASAAIDREKQPSEAGSRLLACHFSAYKIARKRLYDD